MKLKTRFIPLAWCTLLIPLLLSSCTAGKLMISQVDYQSVRTSFAQPASVPETAKIVAHYMIDSSGDLMVVINNKTDKILTIDQTKSFLVGTDGVSKSYYDPNVHTESSGSSYSTSDGTSVNLGAVASLFGIGSTFLSGINVGSSESVGNYSTTTVTRQDQPQVHVAPHGSMVMSKYFDIQGVGSKSKNHFDTSYVDASRKTAPLKFSVCISYSFEEEDPEKLVTDFYVNTTYTALVNDNRVSNAFQEIYEAKPDALVENLYMFNIQNNISFGYSNYVRGSLIDFK